MISISQTIQLEENGWGDCRPIDLGKVLASATTEFFKSLDSTKLPAKSVIVFPSPNNHPDILKLGNADLIRLSARDKRWAKYAYQYTHELCHHAVNSTFFGGIDRFGWLEESLCELASIWTLEEMAATWERTPPYENWRAYSSSLSEYARDVESNPDEIINIDFKEWLRKQMDLLHADRVRRNDNLAIALQLLPIFRGNPQLWQSIQYINQIAVTEEMTLNEFLAAWYHQLPEKIRAQFQSINDSLSI